MNTEAEWQKALNASPDDTTVLLAYGDWLEARQRAGVGRVVYRLSHPNWHGELVGGFAKVAHLKSHVHNKTRRLGQTYTRHRGDTPVAVAELVVVIEWHAKPTEIVRRPYSHDLQV